MVRRTVEVVFDVLLNLITENMFLKASHDLIYIWFDKNVINKKCIVITAETWEYNIKLIKNNLIS